MSRADRRQRLLALAGRHGAEAVVLRRPANYAWYTGGCDNRVDHSDEVGVAAVVVAAAGEWIVTNDIESARIREEQSGGLEVVDHPWTDDLALTIGALGGGKESIDDVTGEAVGGVAALRLVLDHEAMAQYREVGRDARAAMEEAAGALTPSTTERGAAAALAGAAGRHRLFAPVTLVAGARRLPLHRHPVAADDPLGDRAMLVLCGERHGLIASLTRFVHFREPDSEWRRRQGACDTILARMREEATVPGRTMAEVFADCVRFYDEAGFGDEWRKHHQGGIAGYRPREVVAMPSATTVIETGQSFAWNPSITGAKAEETFLLSPDGGTEVITGG